MTKMGSNISPDNRLQLAEVLRGQRHITKQKLTQVAPPPPSPHPRAMECMAIIKMRALLRLSSPALDLCEFRYYFFK